MPGPLSAGQRHCPTSGRWRSCQVLVFDALGDYNADAETFALTSALWPVNFKVKVSPKEAARFREGFARRTFGTPELVFQLGAIVLKSVPVVVSFNGEAHTYSLTR